MRKVATLLGGLSWLCLSATGTVHRAMCLVFIVHLRAGPVRTSNIYSGAHVSFRSTLPECDCSWALKDETATAQKPQCISIS